MTAKPKVVIVMPAFNTAHVLKKTYADIPKDGISEIILVDDGSTDGTGVLAEQLGLIVVRHAKNKGYGAAQKTGYQEALRRGADAVVMVHSDNQYDPALTPKFIEPIVSGMADAVTGTRIFAGNALRGGMPIWKYIANRFLTGWENRIFNTRLTDYHNGFRAYSRKVLESIDFERLSDKFDFDTDIIIQIAIRKFRIWEIPHHTRYLSDNSQMSFYKGVEYGLRILLTSAKFILHKLRLKRFEVFEDKQV